MINNGIVSVIKSCFITIVAIYGTWSLLVDTFCSIIPFGVLFTVALVGAVYFFRIPPPSTGAVEAIVGRELHFGDIDNVMKTVAHRGAGLDAPENSLHAFQMCKDKGCDAIEFDITLTSDGQPIVFHDRTLERMANSTLVVNDHKWEELVDIDISVKHPYGDRFCKTNIPTLEQTITQLLSSGQRMFIDIKDNNTKMVPVVLNLFKKHPELHSKAVVSSFYPNIIYTIRRSNPNIVCSIAWRPHAFAHDSYKYPEGAGPRRAKNWYTHYVLRFLDVLHEWALPRITYYLLGLSIILLHKDSVSGEAILRWRKKGIRVMAWTVNSPIEKQHLARNLKITYLTDTLTGEDTTHLFWL